jgi:isoleucyl-tRNA synthetase
VAKLYPEYKQLNLPAIAQEIAEFWKHENVFEQSISTREGHTPFVFYEGPPSANGLPGIHHVMARAIKDIFCRYKTLQGFQVKRKAGWDTHGLPIELGVEKSLGIKKEDIGTKITVEGYNQACREDVMKYTDKWEQVTDLMGYWVDMQHPYITYDNKYIETVWWLLGQLYEKDLIYKGFTIQPYSPAAGTGLSSHELNQPGTYKMVKDTTVVAQFKISDFVKLGLDNNSYFLAWTTTPWTLPSNTALAIGKNIEYVAVKSFNQYTFLPITVILAKDLLYKHFSEKNKDLQLADYKSGDKNIPFQVIKTFSAKDLDGIKYEQLLPYAQPETGDAFRVVIGDFVTTTDGTGIVHIAPSFGGDDFKVARQYGIGSLTLVDKRGKFTEEVKPYALEYVKEAYLSEEEKEVERQKQEIALKGTVAKVDKYMSVDERLALQLKIENKAFKIEKYEHSYPHCWRTDKPILYYPLDSWFIKTTAVKDRMIELNKTINWKPEHTGTGRFGEWLNNLQDWNLSRSRFWGIPIPIWSSEDGSERKVISSVEQLQKEIALSIEKGIMKENPLKDFIAKDFSEKNYTLFDLHKPYIDRVVLVSDSGKPMQRESDLIDVWFDSGAMPYAQLHYPFENKDLIDDRKYFPADFIAEGVDQTRGWFFTLHAIATMCFDTVAYKNVVSNGLVLDKNGNKMSKRLGNAVDPFITLNKYGADAVRWYMMSNAAPWDNLKFDEEGIVEAQRKLFGTLYNTYGFFSIYANIDGFEINENDFVPTSECEELDRWILSKLHSLVKEVTQAYDDYETVKAARAIEQFVDAHLSNWYIRLSRRRFWKGEMSRDKRAAYETLYQCLHVVSHLMSPIAPFFTDWMLQNIQPNKKQSIHLGQWPLTNESMIDIALEDRMDLAQRISSMVLSIRKKENLKVRQPLQRIQIPILNKEMVSKIEAVKHLILAEVNVKEIEFVDESQTQIIKDLKLNFKTLGKKCGKQMKAVQNYALENASKIIKGIELNGTYTITLEGEQIELIAEDVEIVPVDILGWKVSTDASLTVALDIELSETLKSEGLAREVVNRLQNMRKDSGLDVTDKIYVRISANDIIKNAIQLNKDYICSETLTERLELEEALDIKLARAMEIEEDGSAMAIIQKA